MKRIEFGREESNNPKGCFEKIGTDDGILDAELIDFIGIDGNNYLVSKVMDCFNKSSVNPGSVYVKEALVDIYADGSTVMFLNNGNKEMCTALERTLNSYQISDLIKSGTSLNSIIGNSFVPKSFDIASISDLLVVTEINEDIFNHKKELINECHQTISSMQEELNKFYKGRSM